MIFTNFGFYSGAGSLSVLIDVNEGKDPGDRTFNANVLATSPTFGMLANEGEYSILFGGSTQVSGKFDVNDEGRGSFEVDYENFFVSNGEYTLKTKLGSQESTDRVTLNRMADSLSAEVVSFDGVTDDTEAVYPIDKDSTINLNMQFTASDSTINFINPWVTGTAKVYHHEQPFNENQGEDYWDDDSEHGGSAEQGSLVDTITIDIDSSGGTYTYSSGERVNFDEIQVGQVSLSLRLDPSEFYSEEGSGDYTVVFDFTNDFGSATSSFDGRTYWAWFHICETKSNGKCDGGA
tara:strand:- start:275 stop:1150 length:876 start_codon:yes stop_codon:yes gene_type:complete